MCTSCAWSLGQAPCFDGVSAVAHQIALQERLSEASSRAEDRDLSTPEGLPGDCAHSGLSDSSSSSEDSDSQSGDSSDNEDAAWDPSMVTPAKGLGSRTGDPPRRDHTAARGAKAESAEKSHDMQLPAPESDELGEGTEIRVRVHSSRGLLIPT